MVNPLISLPKVTPKWKRSFQSSDIQPTQIVQSSELNTPDNYITCPTCNINEARYTCPKCMSPYCSAACYKNHDISPDSHVKGGGRCTEAFYREKVSQVTDLHVKDEKNTSQMRDILTRSFYNENNNNNKSISEGETEKNGILTDEELMELAASGLTLDDEDAYDEDRNYELILKSLPGHIRQKFESAVMSGELSHLVQQWHPFWLPNYDKHDLEFDSKFEEQIIAIPPLPHRIEENTKLILQNNICEVIYTAAWAFRKSNNATMPQIDADNADTAVQVASILYSQSQVLSCDARYQNMEQVLMECTELSSRSSEAVSGTHSSDQMINRNTLVNDTICICRHRRMVLKVLLEIIDVIDHAKNILKRRLGSESKKERRNLLLAQKKIHFYASFCQTYWDDCSTSIVACMEKWLHDWALHDEDRQKISDELLIERVKDSKLSRKFDCTVKVKQETCAEPLLIAVTTKKLT